MTRRGFLQWSSALAAVSAAGPRVKIPLGLDAYSVRAFRWKALQLIDFAARLKLDSLQMSAPGDYESLDPAHLEKVRKRAEEVGIALDAAIGCITPTTKSWGKRTDKPEEYIAAGLKVAKALGAKAMRCFVGGPADRPIEPHFLPTLKILRAVKPRLLGEGIKLAIENHGDFLATEIQTLIQEAGPEAVGCCLDTGNPISVLEDPLYSLEVLAPYVVTSHIRDSVVYEHPRGAAFQWVALGDGSIDFKEWMRRFAELCPGVPMQLEIITGRPPQVLPFLEPDFWNQFPNKRGAELARFLKLVRDGHPFTGSMMIAGPGPQPPEYEAALREQQRVDIERSADYARRVLGAGK
jgi:sugar phosphate isomerase/epimerase